MLVLISYVYTEITSLCAGVDEDEQESAAHVIAESVLHDFDTYCPMQRDQDTCEAMLCMAKLAALRGMEFILSQTHNHLEDQLAAPQTGYGFMGMASNM